MDWKKFLRRIQSYLPFFLGVLCAVFVIAFALKPGRVLPQGPAEAVIVRVEEGDTIREVANRLKEFGIVRFSEPASYLLTLFGGETLLKAGAYVIGPDTSPIRALWQVARGQFGVDPIKLTVPEGTTSFELATLLSEKLIDFDAYRFDVLADRYEGYLFPDTYFFLPTVTEEEVVSVMRKTFDEKIREVESQIAESGRSKEDIIIIASLLEKEARTMESRQMIAGIIYNRLEIDMPLQIDAVFGYIQRKATFNPSFKDLEVDSPYNTYKNKGLPPGPIANPGIDAIRAALTPTESEYLYYLTGRDGKMYYSKTFAGHIANRRAYLD